jgi:SAM-dependent methyltransferase
MIFGSEYSNFYDQIHLEKNYENESDQIIQLISEFIFQNSPKILDFGCGTGMHMKQISQKGFDISGYDISSNMISIAQKRLPKNTFYSKYEEIPQIYDFSYSLFDVLSYQISDSKVLQFLSNLIHITKPNGRILIDAWHLDGLLIEPPSNRFRIFDFEGRYYSRQVQLKNAGSAEITTLDISIVDVEKNKVILNESHLMRAFTKDELIKFIREIGGTNIKFFDGKKYTNPLVSSSWRIGAVFQAPENLF